MFQQDKLDADFADSVQQNLKRDFLCCSQATIAMGAP